MHETALLKTADPKENHETLAWHTSNALKAAFTCTLTDWWDVYVMKKVQDAFNKSDASHPEKAKIANSWGSITLAEFVGDYGAVAFVALAHKVFPNFMNGISAKGEPVLSAFFRNGAERGANVWATKHGVEIGSERHLQKVEEIYRRGIDNISDSFVWGVSSIVLNALTQKLTRNETPLATIAFSKVLATSASTGVVLATDAFFPETMYSINSFTRHKIIKPVEKMIDKVFGVKEGAWADKVHGSPTEISR